MRVVRRVSSVLLMAAALSSTGCSKLVGLDFTVVEACGQEGRATAGVASYLLKSGGAAEEDAISFPVGSAAGIAVGLGDSVVFTLAGFLNDISLSANPTAPTELPFSIARSAPLAITESTQDVTALFTLGRVDSFGGPKSAEGTCAALQSGETVAGRHGHTATWLPVVNKVLIVGGAVYNVDGSETLLRSAELFDPATGVTTLLADLPLPRAYHTATALKDGRVVLAGGLSTINGAASSIKSGVIVNVATLDAPYVNIELRDARAHHTATLLEDVGMLVLIGGCTGTAADGCTSNSASGTSTTAFTNTVEIIEINNSFKFRTDVPAGLLSTPRAMHTAIGFPAAGTGVIVVAGGLNANGTVNSLEFLQVNNTLLANVYAGSLPTGLVRHQMTRYNDRQFIITGGQTTAAGGVLDDNAAGVASVLICQKSIEGTPCTAAADMLAPLWGHSAAMVNGLELIVMGGAVPAGAPPAQRFNPTSNPQWAATTDATLTPRINAQLTSLGGDGSAMNTLLYTGGRTAILPYTTSPKMDLYFGR
jgi:hypothetical protein